MAKMTPMMEQYLQIKEKHKDYILFYRLGDFYEMFFDDARLASKELELTLTGRDCGQDERAPMCGVPYHSSGAYIKRLIAKGYKVAICEQMSDPKDSKGLVDREVIKIITPGTVIDDAMLPDSDNNFISSVFMDKTAVGVSFCDISTGEIHCCIINALNISKLSNELYKFAPKEILLNKPAFDNKELSSFIEYRLDCNRELINIDDKSLNSCLNIIKSQFSDNTPDDLLAPDGKAGVLAVGMLLCYLNETQKAALNNLNTINLYEPEEFMDMDISTIRNLELISTMRNNEKRGSLIWVLDDTCTPMGRRLLKKWLEMPLLNCKKIIARQDAVEAITKNTYILGEIKESFDSVFDIERLMSRITYNSANARDLRAIAHSLSMVPKVKELVSNFNCEMLSDINKGLYDLKELYELILSAIVEEPGIQIKEGGIIKSGFSQELDNIRSVLYDTQKYIAELETAERAKTGIKTLKIAHNRVFGYYIEVTRSYYDLVPDTYIRKQTLANCERFVTQELKEFENMVFGARERMVALEYQIFCDIRKKVQDEVKRVIEISASLACLDVLCSFASVSLKGRYVRPEVNDKDEIIIKNGRHPVVEKIMDGAPFVPNSAQLDTNENRTIIITGPNMAGKSTYMRQCALICIMAQLGCFVPAEYAKIGVVDKVFTRVGASDDLSAGQSTFMTEMTEVANILKNASRRSLLIFDEIGRGTSTYDGMSIARAVIEYVHDPYILGAKSLFATHYHELTNLEKEFSGIKNLNVAVIKNGDEISFLRKIVKGAADDSYGIEVAALAGVPQAVIHRAKEILGDLESAAAKNAGAPEQLEIRAEPKGDTHKQVIDKLKNTDLNTLTPLEAMNTLFNLKSLL